ncbi:membrane hypothetical protein [Paraburkholderia unamae]|uniref:hypothetical protein n=1 Tax=Paraburkholderia unamae TaxID=219649 RepID=UPI001CB1FA6D|nr:hypothetical protein [Paraburkholderia unamae]CAG9268350.1 membrane hypothetical protein [Paraburkholderia unamae]
MKENFPSRYNVGDCGYILDLLEQVVKLKRPKKPVKMSGKIMERWNVGFLIASAVGLLVLVVLVPISRVGHVRIPSEVVLFIGIYTELTALASLLSILVAQALYVERVRRNPVGPLFKLALVDIELYAPYVAELASYALSDLQWVKTHLALQRDAFDRRRYFLAGPIDKIGLLPAIVGALTTVPKIVEQLRATVPISWMWNAVGLCVCFYLFVWLTHRSGTRMGFAITLVESAIELKGVEE